MRKFAAATVLVMAVLALGACNTVKGVGRDIESAGEAGEDAINN